MKFINQHSIKIILMLFILLSIKSIQSCNRKNSNIIIKSNYEKQIDSISSLNSVYLDSIKIINYHLELQKSNVKHAQERVNAVESAVEKIKANTTVIVKSE